MLLSEQAPHEQEEDTTSGPVGPLPQSDELNMAAHPQDNNIVEVKVALQPKVSLMGRFHWFCLFEMSVESNSPNPPPFRSPNVENTKGLQRGSIRHIAF